MFTGRRICRAWKNWPELPKVPHNSAKPLGFRRKALENVPLIVKSLLKKGSAEPPRFWRTLGPGPAFQALHFSHLCVLCLLVFFFRPQGTMIHVAAWIQENKKKHFQNLRNSLTVLSSQTRKRAEYGFGEYSFKHRTQWVFLPSPSFGQRTQWVPLSPLFVC